LRRRSPKNRRISINAYSCPFVCGFHRSDTVENKWFPVDGLFVRLGLDRAMKARFLQPHPEASLLEAPLPGVQNHSLPCFYLNRKKPLLLSGCLPE
jgi:hypothetical protein